MGLIYLAGGVMRSNSLCDRERTVTQPFRMMKSQNDFCFHYAIWGLTLVKQDNNKKSLPAIWLFRAICWTTCFVFLDLLKYIIICYNIWKVVEFQENAFLYAVHSQQPRKIWHQSICLVHSCTICAHNLDIYISKQSYQQINSPGDIERLCAPIFGTGRNLTADSRSSR
jgi:hypothetical protein